MIALLKSTIGNASNESQETDDMIDMLEAYWKLAKKRFVDEVGMIVTEGYTNPILSNKLEQKLQNTLFCTDDKGLRSYFHQDEIQKRERKILEETVTMMEQASQRLRQGLH